MLYTGLKNPFALVVIVLLVTALISVSLYKDNKVLFKKITIITQIEKPLPTKKSVKISKKKKSAKTQNTNDNGIEVMPFKETPTPSVQKSFIDNYSFLAIAEMDRTGIPASVTLETVLKPIFNQNVLIMVVIEDLNF